MEDRFRNLFGVFILFVVILGGLGLVRLFSWKSLLTIDKFFYCFAVALFIFGMYLAFLFRSMDSIVSVLPDLDGVPQRDVDKIIQDGRDRELAELRKEKDKVPPYIPKPDFDNTILRSPDPVRSIPPMATRLTDDVSMYQDRNILKPPITQEYKPQEKSEYDNIF